MNGPNPRRTEWKSGNESELAMKLSSFDSFTGTHDLVRNGTDTAPKSQKAQSRPYQIPEARAAVM